MQVVAHVFTDYSVLSAVVEEEEPKYEIPRGNVNILS